jgi:hypothetical protein
LFVTEFLELMMQPVTIFGVTVQIWWGFVALVALTWLWLALRGSR